MNFFLLFYSFVKIFNFFLTSAFLLSFIYFYLFRTIFSYKDTSFSWRNKSLALKAANFFFEEFDLSFFGCPLLICYSNFFKISSGRSSLSSSQSLSDYPSIYYVLLWRIGDSTFFVILYVKYLFNINFFSIFNSHKAKQRTIPIFFHELTPPSIYFLVS